MPTPLTITVDASALSALAATLQDGPARLRSLTRRVMTKQMRWAEGRVKQRVSGEVLKVRSGQLRARLKGVVEEEPDAITGRLGVLKGDDTLIYGAVQEYGKTIVPTAGHRVLTIPLAAAMYASGVARFTAPEAKERFPGGTFWKRTQSGALILFGRLAGARPGALRGIGGKRGLAWIASGVGFDAGIVPLFLGVRRVVIREKRYLRDTVDEVLPRIRDEIQTAVLAAVAASRGATIQ